MCAQFIESLPPEFRNHGMLEVPEDWKNPERSRKIKIFYWGNFTGKRAPIIYINGGPTLGTDQVWSSKFKSLSEAGKLKIGDESIEYIFFDQRGNHCSSPYPSDLESLALYGAREIAQDAEAIRVAVLGKDHPAIMWGQSYGSTVALKYYQLFPDSPSTVVSTGQVGLSTGIMAERYINQARTLEAYFSAYPEDRQRLLRLKGIVRRDFCMDSQLGPVCGELLVQGLAVLQLARPHGPLYSWDVLHQFLESSLSSNQVDVEALFAQLKEVLKVTIDLSFRAESDGPLNVIQYMNILGHDPIKVSQLARQEIAARGIDASEWIISEMPFQEEIDQRLMQNPSFRELMSSMTTVSPDLVDAHGCEQALRATPNKPLTIFVSESDSMAPPEAVYQLARSINSNGALPNLKIVKKTIGGHGLDVDLDVIHTVWKMAN